LNSGSILITGSSGYIGSLLARELLPRGAEISGLDLRPPHDGARLDSLHRVHIADITRPETLPSEIRKTAVLIHCAALVHGRSSDLSRSNYFRINFEGTRNVLWALDPAYLRRIIFLSSVSVYGLTKSGQVTDELTLPVPLDPYGESKLAAEEEIHSFSQKWNIPYTGFRLAPVYGKDFHLNIDKRVYLPKRVAFYKIGDGTQRMSMCAGSNVVNAVAQSLEAGGGLDGIFNLKDSEDYSINDIIAIMRKFNKHFSRPVLEVPGAPLRWVISRVIRLRPGRGDYLAYQLNKIALGAVYSGEKLLSTGVRVPGKLSSEMLSESCS
jgi:UDP-glucose 4-epimerase